MIARVVPFDVHVLHAGRLRLREDIREADDAAADVRHRHGRSRGGVLRMHERKAMRIPLEERDRVAATLCHPVEIHLEVHELVIRLGEQDIEAGDVADAHEFEVMVVVGELEPVVLRNDAELVEVIGVARPIVGVLAFLGGEPRDDDPFVPDDLRVVADLLEFVVRLGQRGVRRWRGEAILLQHRAHLRR